MHIRHDAGLENILEKLVVDHSAARLNLDDETLVGMMCVGLEGLFKRPFLAEQDGHADLLMALLAGLDAKAQLFEMRSHVPQNTVAIQVERAGADHAIAFFKSVDHTPGQLCYAAGAGEIDPLDHRFAPRLTTVESEYIVLKRVTMFFGSHVLRGENFEYLAFVIHSAPEVMR